MDEQGNGVPNFNGTEVTIDTNVTSPFGATSGTIDETTDGSVTLDGGYTVGTEVEDSTTKNSEWKQSSLPTKVGFWGKVKAFLFQEIKVELTPKQQKVEDEINAFLFQEIHFFGKKNKTK